MDKQAFVDHAKAAGAPFDILKKIEALIPDHSVTVTLNPGVITKLIADVMAKNWFAVLNDLVALFGTAPTP